MLRKGFSWLHKHRRAKNEVGDPQTQTTPAEEPGEIQHTLRAPSGNEHSTLSDRSSAVNEEQHDSIQREDNQQDYNSVFMKAHDEFIESLPEREQNGFDQCASAEELLVRLRKFKFPADGEASVERSLRKVKTFSDALGPYFDALGIISQGYPYAAIAWGSLLLVLKLANNFATFFDKLSDTLSRLALQLPKYNALVSIWKKYNPPSTRLKSSLCSIYTHLFQFLQKLGSIFMKDDTQSRSRAAVLASLSWKPFDVRFHDFMDQILLHREVIEDELQLATYGNGLETMALIASLRLSKEEKKELQEAKQRIKEIHKMTQNRLKDEAFDRANNWLSPPDFKVEFENALHKRTLGTAQWLFDHPLFRHWRLLPPARSSEAGYQFDEKVLWIHGNPGCGKTILAASCIEKLESLGATVYYFFFRWDQRGRNDPINAYQALLAQMLHSRRHDQRLLDAFSFSRCHLSRGQLGASKKELLSLLDLCLMLPDPSQSYIVIDGIDECSDGDQLITDLVQAHRDSTAKVLTFSRPNVGVLSEVVPSIQQCSIGRETTPDIRQFLSGELEKLKHKGRLLRDANVSVLLDHLVIGADGMFLWARLMTEYLNKATSLTPARRVKIILSLTFPERLEKMYDRIMDQLRGGYEDDRKFARFIITWLIYARRPLTTFEMRDAAMIWSAESDYPDFEQTVLATCACLVEMFGIYNSRSQRASQGFRLIHQSATEYILKSASNSNPLYVGELYSNFEITHVCLEYLMKRLPGQPLSGKLGEDASCAMVDDELPLCNYATVYWIKHLEALQMAKTKSTGPVSSFPKEQSRQLSDLLLDFLAQKSLLMAWIEATFLFKADLNYKTLLDWSEAYIGIETDAQHPVLDDSRRFCTELEQLSHDWGERLTESPSCIRLEVTAFGFYQHLQHSSAMNYATFSDHEIVGASQQDYHLSEVCSESIDGCHLGKLSVIPSRSFVKLTQSGTIPKLPELYAACFGWVARYEVWTTDEKPILITKLGIPLEKDETWLQMHQSLWFGTRIPSSSEELSTLCKMQFPLAINRTLDTFVILRDIYDLLPSNQGNIEKPYRVARTSFDFSEGIQQRWEPKYFSSKLERRASGLIWGCPPEEVLKRAEAYIYFFTFSADGLYLLFRDEENGAKTNFAAFELQDSDLGLWSLLGTTSKELPQGQEVAWSFHPNKPLASLCFKDRVFLWPLNSRPPRLYLCHKECLPRLREPIGFSECGKNIIIREDQTTFPRVQPIPNIVLRVLSDGNIASKKGYESAPVSRSTTNSSVAVLDFGLAPGSLIPCNFSQVGADGASRGISTLHSKKGVSIQLWDSSAIGSKVQDMEIEVTKLPNWDCMGSASTSILSPKMGDNKLKIIFNKRPTLWNIPSEPDLKLPAVVHRNLDTVRMPKGSFFQLEAGGSTVERKERGDKGIYYK